MANDKSPQYPCITDQSRLIPILLFILAMLFTPFAGIGQEPIFNFDESSYIYYNPALGKGITGGRVNLSATNQYQNTSDHIYNSSLLVYDHALTNNAHRFGFVAWDGWSRSMDNNNMNASVYYTGSIEILNESSISFAFQAGLGETRLDKNTMVSRYKPYNQPNNQPNNVTLPKSVKYYPDLSAGVVFYLSDYLATGFSAHHINKPQEYYATGKTGKLPVKYNAMLYFKKYVSNMLIHTKVLYGYQNKRFYNENELSYLVDELNYLNMSLELSYLGSVSLGFAYIDLFNDTQVLTASLGCRLSPVSVKYTIGNHQSNVADSRFMKQPFNHQFSLLINLVDYHKATDTD